MFNRLQCLDESACSTANIVYCRTLDGRQRIAERMKEYDKMRQVISFEHVVQRVFKDNDARRIVAGAEVHEIEIERGVDRDGGEGVHGSSLCHNAPVIDSHCHLAAEQFDADRAEVIARARSAGLTAMVTIADSFAEGERCLEIAAENDDIFCAVGLHPHHAKDWSEGDGEHLKAMIASSSKVRAVGEIGLDYHYDFSPRDVQKKAFLEQLLIAKELHLPAVIHCREAIADVRAIIEESGIEWFVIHCCTERWEDVAWVFECGGILSFTGIATFPKSTDIHETIRNCPLESMMVETDAPFLAPIPHRGKRCEPAYVVDTARFVAGIKGLSLEQFDAVVTKTTMAFFGLPS